MDIQWPLAVFSTLAGCGGALFAFIGVSELLKIGEKARFNAAVAALALLVIGGCASVLHLEQKANIMAAAANVFSFSGISVELIFLGVNVVLLAAFLITLKRGAVAAARAIALVGIVTGLLMAFVVGNGYIMEARQNWNTLALPIAYLGSGIACGAAVFAACTTLSGCPAEEVGTASRLAVGSAAIALVTAVIYAAMVGFALDGVWFWAVCIAVGCVVTAALAWFGAKQPALLYGAAACALIGGLGLRAAMFLAGTGFIDSFALAASRTVLGL